MGYCWRNYKAAVHTKFSPVSNLYMPSMVSFSTTRKFRSLKTPGENYCRVQNFEDKSSSLDILSADLEAKARGQRQPRYNKEKATLEDLYLREYIWSEKPQKLTHQNQWKSKEEKKDDTEFQFARYNLIETR